MFPLYIPIRMTIIWLLYKIYFTVISLWKTFAIIICSYFNYNYAVKINFFFSLIQFSFENRKTIFTTAIVPSFCSCTLYFHSNYTKSMLTVCYNDDNFSYCYFPTRIFTLICSKVYLSVDWSYCCELSTLTGKEYKKFIFLVIQNVVRMYLWDCPYSLILSWFGDCLCEARGNFLNFLRMREGVCYKMGMGLL